MNYLSVKDVACRFGVSTSSVWLWCKREDLGFPKPIKLGPQVTKWRLDQIEAWEASRRVPAKSGKVVALVAV